MHDIRALYLDYPDPKLIRFTSDSPNNRAVLSDGRILLVTDVIERDHDCRLDGYVLIFRQSLYTFPYDLALLSIGYYCKSKTFLGQKVPSNKAILVSRESFF